MRSRKKMAINPFLSPAGPIWTATEGYVDAEGRVKVSPMIYGRQEDALYLHGHVSAGILKNGPVAALGWDKAARV